MSPTRPLNRRPIADLGLLSDSHSSALVAADATVVWCCLPRFDSPPVFGGLFDDVAGYWSLQPSGWVGDATSRTYLDSTMLLRTTFEDQGGQLEVTDAMPFTLTEDPHDLGTGAPHAIVRHVTCTSGSVEVEMDCEPRPEFGLMVPLLREIDGGAYCLGGSWSLVLSSTEDLEIDDDARARARFALDEGDDAWFAIRRLDEAEVPEAWDRGEMQEWLEDTRREWQQWDHEHRRYEGPWGDLVRTSGRVLQSLTYWPTGAMVAAPTTSLPEEVGGVRNWDYRFSWVRDTSMIIEALRVASCPREAARFLDWIVRTAGGDIRSGQDLQIMYGIGGEHEIGERTLPHLDGWRDSAPVRVGNEAWHQRQLDVYGELLDAVFDVRGHLDELDGIEVRFLRDLADKALELWEEPDYGIWEVRAEPRHYVHSKLMCWVALDRAVQMADEIDASEEQVSDWKEGAEAVREAILERGWNEEVGAFVQSFGSDRLDASVLVMAIERFLPADDPRMRSTIDAIDADLVDERGLVYRYLGDDGLPGEEGTFLLCTFWLAQCLAMAGEVGRAEDVFERAAAHVNDLGLMSEEVDPATGELLGNFPQAFSHIGLVNAAQAIARARGDVDEDRWGS
ncbi:MAG: glycoside hydrolase family 15 protein [Actinobacteria bacterium]|nr:glycoside hydrolase family 15 protein [Actinomycetota bacterium]